MALQSKWHIDVVNTGLGGYAYVKDQELTAELCLVEIPPLLERFRQDLVLRVQPY